jgi:hypothetical protein
MLENQYQNRLFPIHLKISETILYFNQEKSGWAYNDTFLAHVYIGSPIHQAEQKMVLFGNGDQDKKEVMAWAITSCLCW